MTTAKPRFLQFIARWNRGASEGQVRIPYECLLVLARKLGGLVGWVFRDEFRKWLVENAA